MLYFKSKKKTEDKRYRKKPQNALSEPEMKAILDVLNSSRFVDETPYQIVPKLMDEGLWLCSIRTMYRVLSKHRQIKDRRNQLRHPKYVKPIVVARDPNEAWSWDITQLQGPFKGRRYYLYVMLDLFSRYVVGWMVCNSESGEQAQHFIRETLKRHKISEKKLIIHSDRGSPMTASNTISLLATLGLSQSFSRPRISNDNPFSESQFKTMKYHRYFKKQFESLKDAEQTLDKFFAWYNNDHMHINLGLMTPAMVHYGQVQEVFKRRETTMSEAFRRFPERFSNGFKVKAPAKEVGINLPKYSTQNNTK